METKKIVIIIGGVLLLIVLSIFIFHDLPEVAIDTEEEEEEGVDIAEILAKAEDVDSIYYDIMGGDADEERWVGKFWQRGEKSRLEIITDEGIMISILNPEEDMAHIYLPSYRVAMKMDNLQEREVREASIKEKASGILRYSPVIVGEENFNGKDCIIIEYKDEDRDEDVKMWVWQDFGIPVKVIAEVDGDVSQMEVSNVDFNEIDEDIFVLPEETEVMEMPE